MIDECKWMQDEVCVNADCPACADYCPVANTPGVCKYEEGVSNFRRCLDEEQRTGVFMDCYKVGNPYLNNTKDKICDYGSKYE